MAIGRFLGNLKFDRDVAAAVLRFGMSVTACQKQAFQEVEIILADAAMFPGARERDVPKSTPSPRRAQQRT